MESNISLLPALVKICLLLTSQSLPEKKTVFGFMTDVCFHTA